MRKTPFALILRAISTLLILLPVLLSAQAQDSSSAGNPDLLINPGFEQPYIAIDATFPRQVAEGWTPWNLPPETSQPEYQAASVANPARALSGSDAQMYFSFLSTHVAGVYQTVTGLQPATSLTFSVNAYVWSSSDDSNPDFSSDPGGVTVEVGIDPTGGTEPQSSAIIWSAPVEQYDGYFKVSVSTASVGDTVTVFVRSSIAEERLLTEIYLDDAALTQDSGLTSLETDEPAATEEPTLEPSPSLEPAQTEVVELPTEEVVASETLVLPTELPTEDTGVTQTADADLAATDAALAQSTADAAGTGTAVFVTVVAQATNGALTSVAQLDQTSTAVIVQATNNAVLSQANDLNLTITAQALIIQQTSQAPTNTPAVMVITATPEPATSTPIPTETEIIPSPTTEPPTAAPIEPTATPFDQPTVVPGEPTAVIPFSETFPGRIIHTVRNGETVSILSELYGSSIDAIIVANGLNENALIYVGQGLIIPVRVPPIPETTPTPAFIIVTATPDSGLPAGGTYIVRPGDTLSQIAARNNTTVRTLAQLNGIVNFNSIQVGQRLLLPGGVVTQPDAATATPAPELTRYVVQPGDSLYKIALKYKVSVQQLADLNRIANWNRIFYGQVLVIPQ